MTKSRDNADNWAGDISGVTAGTGLTGGGTTGAVTLAIDSTVATLSGTQTLSNKTIALGSNTVSGTTAQFNTALTDGDFATLAGSETLTNKTVALGSNTVSGTIAQFNTALTDGDFATIAGTETLSNKTLTNPSVTGALVATGAVIGSAAGSGVGLKSEAAGGGEGGQLNLAPAPTGGTGSDAIIDVFQTSMRLTPNNFTTTVRLGSDYPNNGSTNIRNITISTSTPSGGNDGDVWIQYT